MDDGAAIKALELKAALRRDADDSGIPYKQQADLLGVAESTFYAYLDPSTALYMPSHRMPRYFAINRPCLSTVRYFAGLQGAVVVTLPTASPADLCHLGDVVMAMGTFIRTHANATADGRWTREEVAELKDIERQLHTCVAAQVLHAERAVDMPASTVTSMRRATA